MSLYGQSYQPRNKLRREGIERTVLPPLPGGHTYSAAYTYVGVGHTGYQQPAASSASVLTGSTRGASGLLSASSNAVGSTGARVRERIEEVKERQKERRERHKTRTRPDEIQKSNLVVDSDGIAHDSEYVQFRTATPVHVQARTARRNRREVEGIPNDDDSASSASSSSTSSQGSGFQSSPYTYQSTHRTVSTSQNHRHHHHSSTLYPPTRSAIPSYLATQNGRTSIDGGGSMTVPRAPSPAKRTSAEYDRTSLDRGGSNTSLRPSATRTRAPGGQQFSTSSFQPPAAFNPIPPSMTLSANQPPLRNAPSIAQLPPLNTSDTHSLTSSTARLSLGTSNPNESGYNKFARSDKQRGERKEGNVLDAGVHGMKRSWDGFKLDMRFGAHKVGKKVSRKVTSAIG
ncbi:hypothetical protein JCM11491_006419 [Sporobolomyces phaffii]